ncbi:MAG: orotidine-5'-phosphate decarboxylase [Alphaproteobacteria bacterium]|nr:orotidine-5'-phosphate decarboxylase [Alphaproteobacteria bacterium]
MSSRPLIFCALDTADLEQARLWARAIGPVTGALKLGMEFVNAHGPAGIETVQKAAPDAALFIDLKFHDIPNTVAGAVRTICRNFAPAYLNVHAAGGRKMMEAAKEACEATSTNTKLLAVTILTSLSEPEIIEVGYTSNLEEKVQKMALLAKDSGMDGVVCSPFEARYLRKKCGKNFDLITPGVRPSNSDTNDQYRVMTPKHAISEGATHLVIGRPITDAPDLARAAQEIMDSLK